MILVYSQIMSSRPQSPESSSNSNPTISYVPPSKTSTIPHTHQSYPTITSYHSNMPIVHSST